MSFLSFVDRVRRLVPQRGKDSHAKPALPIEQSITKNFIVCLDTGTRHAALRRHLWETLGLTPAEYRRRWGLPKDYPMVAENYVKRREDYSSRSLLKMEE